MAVMWKQNQPQRQQHQLNGRLSPSERQQQQRRRRVLTLLCASVAVVLMVVSLYVGQLYGMQQPYQGAQVGSYFDIFSPSTAGRLSSENESGQTDRNMTETLLSSSFVDDEDTHSLSWNDDMTFQEHAPEAMQALERQVLSSFDYALFLDPFEEEGDGDQQERHASFHSLTSDTVCHAESTFRNPTRIHTIRQARSKTRIVAAAAAVASSSNVTEPTDEEWLLEEWQFRLTYLAIHRHYNHEQLFPRRRRRYNPSIPEGHTPSSFCNTTANTCQCRSDTKFFVVDMGKMGLGATLRMNAIKVLLLGVVANRLTVFVNSIEDGPWPIANPWALASCPSREDVQCTFLPTTPCSLPDGKQGLLRHATILNEVDARTLRRTGILTNHSQHQNYTTSNPNDEPILVLESRVAPYRPRFPIHAKINRRLAAIANGIVNDYEAWVKTKQTDDFVSSRIRKNHISMLRKAVQRISRDVPKEEIHGLPNAVATATHTAALVYLMRPRPDVQKGTNAIVSNMTRTGRTLSTTSTKTTTTTQDRRSSSSSRPESSLVLDENDDVPTIGLPIRGSDKCEKEMLCLPTEWYMELIQEIWTERYAPLYQHNDTDRDGPTGTFQRNMTPIVLLSTEDSDIRKHILSLNRENSESHTSDGPPSPAQQQQQQYFDIRYNPHDILQSSGFPSHWRQKVGIRQQASADDVVFHSFVAIKLQLQAAVSLLNCCSNFHRVLQDLLRHGCGQHHHLLTQRDIWCLQHYPNRKYNVCCGWTNNDECHATRKAHEAARLQQQHLQQH